jgi:hypothetical protein
VEAKPPPEEAETMLSTPGISTRSSREEIVIGAATCVAGLLGVFIGVLETRALEAGLGALMTFFGTWALADALRG